MLRITIDENQDSVVLRLEGQLIRPWVEDVEQCWRNRFRNPRARSVQVDLSAVNFVDTAGGALLPECMRPVFAWRVAVLCCIPIGREFRTIQRLRRIEFRRRTRLLIGAPIIQAGAQRRASGSVGGGEDEYAVWTGNRGQLHELQAETGRMLLQFVGTRPESVQRDQPSDHVSTGRYAICGRTASAGRFPVVLGEGETLHQFTDGKVLILKMAGPGEMLGLSAVISGAEYELTAETAMPCQVNFVSREPLLDMLQRYRGSGSAFSAGAEPGVPVRVPRHS